MRPPLSYAPAFPASLGLVAGIVVNSMGIFYTGICVSLVLFGILYFTHRVYYSFFALFAACGIIVNASHEPTYPPEEIFSGKHKVEGEIIRTIERQNSTAYVVEIDKIGSQTITPFKARVTNNSVENIFGEGSSIKFLSVFRPIDIPGDIPNEIDYNKYLKSEGIVCTGVIISGITLLSNPNGFHRTVKKTREWIYNSIVNSPCSPSTASFLIASLLGDKNLLTEDDFQQFRSTGVAHILALSGLHLGIIATVISTLLFPFSIRFRHRRLRGAIVIASIWTYAILVGMMPSILRASIMITVLIISSNIGRGYFVFNSLFISIIVILLINPAWLFTPGFQLSVAAVASILMFGNFVPIKLKKYPILFYILNLTLIPIAAMLGTGIVSAYYFGSLPSMFMFGNAIAGLFFPWILTGGAILAVFTGLHFNFVLLGKIVDFMHDSMTSLLSYFSGLGGEIANIYFSPWMILPYAIAIIFLAFAIRQRKQHQWLMFVSMLCICVIVNSCDTEQLPAAELYIPRLAQSTRIIMRTGNECRLFTQADLTDMEIAECNSRYRRFLMSRGCSDNIGIAEKSWKNSHFAIGNDYIKACDKLIRLVKPNQHLSEDNMHTHYALVTNTYTGKITELKRHINCDTILLGPDLHPSRRARMIRECADSIPFRDIHKLGFSLIW